MDDLSIKIAEHIIDIYNKQLNIQDKGLFSGDTGICLFFYTLSRKTGNKEYEAFADKLLDSILDIKTWTYNPSFSTGLSGAGWVIEYLIQNGFVEGNSNEVLRDIDDIVYRSMSGMEISISIENGLLGFIFYLLKRLENADYNSEYFLINKSLLMQAFDSLDKIMPDLYRNITLDIHYNSFLPTPLSFYAIAKSLKLNLYTNKLKAIIKQWCLLYIPFAMPALHLNRLVLANSLKTLYDLFPLEEIDKQIDLLLYSLEKKQILKEVNFLNLNLGVGSPGVTAHLKFARDYLRQYPNFDLINELLEIIERKQYRFIEKQLNNVDSIGLLTGLAGIAWESDFLYLFK